MACRERTRVWAAIAGAAFVVLAGAGCTSLSLRASEARTPICSVPCRACAARPSPRELRPHRRWLAVFASVSTSLHWSCRLL